MLADRFDVRLRCAKERPATGKEKPVEVWVAGEDILNNLNRFAGVIFTGKRRARHFGIVGAVHGLSKSFDSVIQIGGGQTARDNRKFAFRKEFLERFSSFLAPAEIV